MLLKDKQIKTNNNGFLISLYAFLVVLTPIFNIGIGVPIRLDDIFLLFLVVKTPVGVTLKPDFLKTILLCFCFSCLLSFLLGLADGKPFLVTNANDVLVVLRMILIANVAKYYLKSTTEINRLFFWMTIAIGISAIIAVLQYSKIQPVALFLTKIYSQDSIKYLAAFKGYATTWRVVSTYGNPNYAGLFFCFGAMFCMHRAAQHNRIGMVYGILYVAFIAVCILTVSSRTSLFIIAFCSLFYLLSSFFVNRHRMSKNLILFIKVVCVIGAIVMIYNVAADKYIPTRIKNFLMASRDAEQLHKLTISSRGTNWNHAIDALNKSGKWLFGNGPGTKTSIDSEYLYVIYTQGILGIALVIILWLNPLLTFLRIKAIEDKNQAVFLFTVILSLPIFGINAPVLFNAKVGPIVILLLGTWQVLQARTKMHKPSRPVVLVPH